MSMKYRRLTNNNRDEYDLEYDFCCGCKYFGEPCGCNRPNGTCGNYDRFIETYNRLAELENKIEAGILVPTYSVVGGGGTYCVCTVDTDNLLVIDEYETKSEAEKKLEELQDENRTRTNKRTNRVYA